MHRFLVSIFSFIIIVSFFLPWLSVEQIQAGAVKKVFAKEGVIILELSGFNIPLQANGNNSSFILSLAKVFSPGLREFAHKSWLLWLVPLIAVYINRLSKRLKKSKLANIYIIILGLGLSVTAGYKVINLDLDNIIYKVELKEWFWVILFSFFIIGVLGLMQFNNLTAKKPKH